MYVCVHVVRAALHWAVLCVAGVEHRDLERRSVNDAVTLEGLLMLCRRTSCGPSQGTPSNCSVRYHRSQEKRVRIPYSSILQT